MSIGVVLADVVPVLGHGRVRCELLQPGVVVVVQAGFVIVDEHRRSDVHGIHEGDPFADAALPEAVLDLGGDVDEAPAGGDVKPEFFTE